MQNLLRRPVWSPDGAVLIFGSRRTGASTLFSKSLANNEPERPLFATEQDLFPESFTTDGKAIVYQSGGATPVGFVWRLDGSAPS